MDQSTSSSKTKNKLGDLNKKVTISKVQNALDVLNSTLYSRGKN
jgi:hypothetical protein